METTGMIIQASGILSAVSFSAVSLFLGGRVYGVLSRIEELMEEFVNYHHDSGDVSDSDEERLATLSHTYRALKKQMERHGEADGRLLRSTLKDLKDRKSMLSKEKMDHLYYAAWRKFRELEREVSKLQ